MFKLKAPCKDCPFRKDKPHQKGWLGSGRAKEIYENIAEQDGFFSCHKTVNYASENAGLDSGNKFCAGAIGVLQNEGKDLNNRNIRLAYMLGLLKKGEINIENVFNSGDDFTSWHGVNR